MTDHAGFCEGCPVLRQAALAERMARYGMVREDILGEFANAIMIAIEREEHGCRGPRGARCRLAVLYHNVRLKPRDDVPLLLKPPRDGRPGDPGQFL